MELPFANPIAPEQLFKAKRAKLADFDTPQAADADDDGIPAPPTAEITEFRPFLPLYGKNLCEKVILGLYGADGQTGNFWNWKHLPIYLRDYVNSISDEPTRLAAQNAIMGMVTKTVGSTKHAGNVPVKAATIPAVLKPWLKDHLNTTPK